jgi:hypothetical protein
MRRRRLAWVLMTAAPLAAPVVGADRASADEEAVEPGLLEFLAEEAGVDEDLSDALLSGDLDRAVQQSARNSKVKDDDKDPQ